jgi:hypothetical protein
MRVVTFADGFISTSPPPLEGAYQQSEDVLNGAVDQDLLTIEDNYRSTFIDFEISRSDSLGSFAETGRIVMVFKDGLWDFAVGLTQGDEIVNSSNPEGLSFSVQNDSGSGILKYSTGTMGSSYEGKIKLIITKVKAL